LGKIGVVLDLLHGAKTAGQAIVFGEIDGTHTAAPDYLAYDIALSEDLVRLEGLWHRNLVLIRMKER
jgi:hypothetical protein